jgi:hypothetical protein
MPISNARRFAVCVALVAGFAQAALAADILIADAKSQPESLTVAPGGVLIVGSASAPFVYKVRPGSTTAEKFVDASAEGDGTFFFGMLAKPPRMTRTQKSLITEAKTLGTRTLAEGKAAPVGVHIMQAKDIWG